MYRVALYMRHFSNCSLYLIKNVFFYVLLLTVADHGGCTVEGVRYAATLLLGITV